MTNRTSKSIAERIDVDYYRRVHPLRRWKRRISWGAFLAVAAAIAFVTFGLQDHRMYQAGPVSDYHQLFAQDCERCHTHPWQTGKRLATLSEAHRTVPDAACEECHKGPSHNAFQIDEDVQRCAECHREHRGNKELATVANDQCLHCHRDLKTKDGEHRFEQSITAFATHPEFRVLKDKRPDPGTIRFNHSAHLAEAILKPYGHGDDVDGQERVQLQCADCHQPDSTRQYMLPINYERHCAECHSSALTFDTQLFPRQPVPHGLPVDTVRGALRERYAKHVTENREEVLGAPASNDRRRMPWHSFPAQLDREEFEWVNDRLGLANDAILSRKTGCAYCHDVEKNDDGLATRVVPANIPDRWFEHSFFKHDSHRMLNCEACHEGAKESKLTSDVLLPGVDSCKKCHGPTSLASGSARDDCVSCHYYHDHKQYRDFNGPFPLDPSQWPAPSQRAQQSDSDSAAELLGWLRISE